MNTKHFSKLYKGFLKQVKRQDEKPETKLIRIDPIIMSYDDDEGYIPLCRKVYNPKWRGMNLKELVSSFKYTNTLGGMYSKFKINSDGKYILTMYGKQLLNKKKSKK